MSPYRMIPIQEQIHQDDDMSKGERWTLLIMGGLNLGSIVALLYMLIFHFDMILFRIGWY